MMEAGFFLTFIGFIVVAGVINIDVSANRISIPIDEKRSPDFDYNHTDNDNCKPPKPKCTKNEIAVSCVNSVCEHRNCSDIGKPVRCIRLDPKKCREGCICKNKYLRDDKTGKCIPEKRCPNNKCRHNEIYDVCPPNCPSQSCDVDERLIDCAKNPEPGDPACNPGCRCIDGYKKNKHGECIPKEQCHKKCRRNEIYDVCPPNCPSQSCDVDERLIKCAKNPKPGDPACNPGCRCIDGYKKNKHGECIPKEQCHKKCRHNEIYDVCPPNCPPQSCDVDERLIDCAKNPEPGDPACNPGCRCIDGYKKNKHGECIPKEQCHKKCRHNEIYDICPPNCPSQSCDVDERLIKCAKNPEPGDPACNPGCRCIDGYKKNKHGECIPKEQCPGRVYCGPNEIISNCVNGGCGIWNCSQPGEICIKLPEGACREGCHCRDSYLRADNGTCIPADQCPPTPISCRPDEVFNECANGGCGQWECSQRAPLCVDLVQGGCVPGCRCKEPLLRSDDGTCVPREQCPLTCYGQNEVIGCRTLCPETCNSIGKTCTIIEPAVCIPACRCDSGFYRNEYGVCVTKKECPPILPKDCKPNEVYNGCANGGCGRWECWHRGLICIDLVEGGCVPGCRCKEPLLRADNGSCVPANQCYPPVSCGPDEVFNECANGGCGQWECSQGAPLCVDLLEGWCVPGCRCKEPLLRSDDGTCVPREQCPLTCYGQNEVIGCRSGCSETCDSIGKACTIMETAVCIPACRCRPGFYRNKNGECVSKEQCYNKCGLNEIYDICPPTCPPPRCDFDEKVSLCLPNPKPGDKACKPGCRCIDNYKQNASKICIPKEECPPIPIQCRPDEVYNECANGGCGRWECWQQGEICIDPFEGGCVPGCRCAEPLLRAEDGSCVPADQCPLVCHGQNEMVGLHTLCPETCESIGKKCTIIEHEKCKSECRCKPGFYRNKIGNCISKEQCLKCTGPHEYFSCGSACDNVCENLSTQNQTHCPIINIMCNSKCYCEENYARNNDNICIPIENCYDKENGIKKFTEGNEVFTEKFLKVASEIQAGSSVIYSPFSLLFLLAQLALYASGTSKQQLLNVLNLQNDRMIRSTIPPYLNEFNYQQNVSLDLAERVYANIQYKLSKQFLKDSENIFNAEAQNLDFSKSLQAAKIINDWVALKTHDLIQNLVSPDTLSSNTRLVLVNAIYFKGNWRYPFKKENTKQQDFFVNNDKTVKVNMMSQIGYFNYAEINKPNIQVLQLPYENGNLTYLVCLPKCENGINELINALQDPSLSILKTAIGSLKSRRVDVSIPSMETTTTTNLEQVLRKLNVTAIFDPQTAGLRAILEQPEELFVSSATQKATIIVNETGTKAAAANAIVVGVTSVQQPVEITKFVADRTFAYFILYKETPIFCGIYRGLE